MALTDWTTRVGVEEIHRGRDGSAEIQDKSKTASSLRRYTRVFRVVTETVTDEAVKVRDLLKENKGIVLGSWYPEDTLARCRRIRARQESFSKHVWLVTCAYSTEFEVEEDPLSDPPRITWNTDQYTRPYHKDRSGNAILNAAGERFDPPVEGDDSRWAVSIQVNVAAVPLWLLGYANAINNGAISIDGVTAEEECAKMHSITIGEEQMRNDVVFRVLTMQIQFRGKDDRDEGWKEQTLNDGLNQKVDGKPVKCKDKDGHPVTEPVLLNLDGTQMISPSPANAEYIKSDIYNLKNFVLLPAISEVAA